MGDAHFVAVPSSAKVPPAAVTADVLVDPRLSDEIFKTTEAKNGSFPVRASERSAYVIDGLAAGQAYDVFYMIEVRTVKTFCKLALFLDEHGHRMIQGPSKSTRSIIMGHA